MHFWIDKRSQGCGFSGHRVIPPSLSGSRRNQLLLLGRQYHSKVMVTPVHRFQSIESVATNGLRHTRMPTYYTRYPGHYQSSSHNGSTSNVRNANLARSFEILNAGNTPTPQNAPVNAPTARLKCGVWAFFAIVTFFLAGAKYYFHGVNMGMEALAFCSLLVVILIVGGLVSLYEALTTSTMAANIETANVAQNNTDQLLQESSEDLQNQVPTVVVSTSANVEPPPPPYHIAIMLPTQHERNRIIQDSPPPSYDKAVT